MRVLIVEDFSLLAMELECELVEGGHEILGVAGTLQEADILALQELDLAIVDVNLPDGSGYDLARRLTERGARIIFASGVQAAEVPADLANWPFLAKPFDCDSLNAALSAIDVDPVL